MDIEDSAAPSPRFILEDFFSGGVTGEGMFFKRSGTPVTRMTVHTTGQWDGTTLRLHELIRYESGENHERNFVITKLDDQSYRAECDEFTEPGSIESYGNTLRWSYTLEERSEQAKGRTMTMDDWMFLQDGGTVLNRAYAKKLGLTVGEVFFALRKI